LWQAGLRHEIEKEGDVQYMFGSTVGQVSRGYAVMVKAVG